MKRIPNTELDYEDHDAIVLDHFLGGDGEDKIEWAKRVWNGCKDHFEGKKVPSVYKPMENQTWQERAKELWENKKQRRKEALCKNFKLPDEKPETLLRLKDDPRYKTRDEMDALQLLGDNREV